MMTHHAHVLNSEDIPVQETDSFSDVDCSTSNRTYPEGDLRSKDWHKKYDF